MYECMSHLKTRTYAHVPAGHDFAGHVINISMNLRTPTHTHAHIQAPTYIYI